VDADLAAVAKVEVHCKAVMEVAAFLFCFAAMAMHGVKPFSKIVVCQTRNVACHDVVHMEADGVLFAVNHFVGNAGIIASRKPIQPNGYQRLHIDVCDTASET